MTNEEITVKYYTSIKNTDAADRTWSPGAAAFAVSPGAGRESAHSVDVGEDRPLIPGL